MRCKLSTPLRVKGFLMQKTDAKKNIGQTKHIKYNYENYLLSLKYSLMIAVTPK